jgi:hypothetical protein
MKRTVVASMTMIIGLVVAGALLVGRTHVPTNDIEQAVTRRPELMSRAWQLPVAATFKEKVNWQSNG